MEYDILNDIITASVGALFQLPLPTETPSIKTDESLGSRNPSQQNQVSSIMSNSNSFSPSISESKKSNEFKKGEQKQEAVNKNIEYQLSLNQTNSNPLPSQKGITLKNNVEPADLQNDPTKESFSQIKPKEVKETSFESQNTIKNQTIKINTQPTLALEQWVQQIGPQKLIEALERLNLNLNTVNKVNLAVLSSKQLETEKKNVKNELKRYDSHFTDIFKRMPNRAEKEPMRPLYIYYKKLKQGLSKDEIEEKNITTSESSKPHSLHNVSIESEKNPTNLGLEFGLRDRENKAFAVSNSFGRKMDSSFEENLNRDKIFGKGGYQESNKNIKPDLPLKIEKKMTKEEAKKKLEILDAVKTTMREKLHSYQVEFTKNNNRKIKYHKDIIPVEEEYKRYKEIKEEMAALEEFLRS